MGLKNTGILALLLLVHILFWTPLQAFQELQDKDKPLGFMEHKVDRKETIFGITRQYRITEKELKRYNPELYSSELKKGMLLQIPRFASGHMPDSETLYSYIEHVVNPGETRWSIAHAYGISIDSLVVLNPQLPDNSSILAVGDTLKLPEKPNFPRDLRIESQDSLYRVPLGKTLFSLAKEFGVSQENILELNPQITENRELQEGMLLKIPNIPAGASQSESGFAYYEVRPKQTQFSLPGMLGTTWEELLLLNPVLSEGLKAGMVLKVPLTKGDFSIKNGLVVPNLNLMDSINGLNSPKIAVLFPFRLDRLNLANEEETLERIESNNAIKYSLGLYSGMLVAMDSLADLGISVVVKAYDTQLGEQKIGQILENEDWTDIQAVVGPIDSRLIGMVSTKMETLNIPVISPLPLSGSFNNLNLFATYTAPDILREDMMEFLKDSVSNQKLFVIGDRNNSRVVTDILNRFPQARRLFLKQEEENIYLNTNATRDLLSKSVENWFIVETDDFKIASSLTSILNSLNTEETPVRMFTTFKGKAFENEVISAVHLSNLRFTFPSAYGKAPESGFTRRYRDKFGGSPDRFAIRGFDLGMDILLRLAYKPNLFQVADQIGLTQYTGNSFDYFKKKDGGYYNIASYILKYDQLRIQEIQKR